MKLDIFGRPVSCMGCKCFTCIDNEKKYEGTCPGCGVCMGNKKPIPDDEGECYKQTPV